MKPYLKKYLFLSIFIYTLSLHNLSAQTFQSDNGRAIIDLDGEKPLLYHGSFKVFKYEFTGLIVYKYLAASKETRIVFLSEAGLSIAEFTLKNNEISCLKTLPMVDKKAAKKYLSRIIWFTLTTGNCCHSKLKTEENRTTQICKGKNGKHYYLYKDNSLQKITKKKGIYRKAEGTINNTGQTDLVHIKKRKKLLIELKIVENAIK